jgi:hypothetical protein
MEPLEVKDNLAMRTTKAASARSLADSTSGVRATTDGSPLDFLDDAYPSHEQLPRRFNAVIRDIGSDGDHHASLVVDGVVVGDHLTDNAWLNDGFRFHDAFHLANAAVLGWSPCLRRMLKRKRKSAPRVDEIEDGARAIILEETIVALVFDYCSSHAWLERDSSIDPGFLDLLSRLTAHLECGTCPPALWASAIRDGANAWRALCRTGEAIMVGDLLSRRLQVISTAPSS